MLRALIKSGLAIAAATVVLPLTACGGGNTVLAAVGSEAAQGVMQDGTGTHQGLASLFNASQSTIKVVNVPAKLGSPFPATVSVAGDKQCGAYTWDNSDADHTPPNGGSAGVTRLNQNAAPGSQLVGGNACVDIARNARGRSGESANDEMYEFALDGVSVSVYPFSNANVPGTLSVQDVKDIFSCDGTGQAPLKTKWNQLTDAVNTDTNAIHRFLPGAGAATRNFFLQQYLGVPSANTGSFIGLGCTSSPNPNPLNIQTSQQNIGTDIPAAERQFAVSIYSAGNWIAQQNGVDPAGDARGGSLPLSICTGPGLTNCKSPTTLNEDPSLAFFGQRPITNVIRHDAPSYTQALSFVGVSASGNGFICSTDSATHTAVANIITKFGFKPLTAKPAGSGLPLSYCRKL